MRVAALACLILALAACTTAPPKIVGAPPPGISYRIENGDTGATAKRADHYCAEFGKHAQLQGVNSDAGAQIAQYACS